jgi:hypothetical protein
MQCPLLVAVRGDPSGSWSVGTGSRQKAHFAKELVEGERENESPNHTRTSSPEVTLDTYVKLTERRCSRAAALAEIWTWCVLLVSPCSLRTRSRRILPSGLRW